MPPDEVFAAADHLVRVLEVFAGLATRSALGDAHTGLVSRRIHGAFREALFECRLVIHFLPCAAMLAIFFAPIVL